MTIEILITVQPANFYAKHKIIYSPSQVPHTAILTINPADPSDNASNYNVIVYSPCSPNDTSMYVSLIVYSLPTACITVCEGSKVSFSSPVAETGLIYQWRKGTINLIEGENISGTNTSFLTINHVKITDQATDYNVVITGRCLPFEVSNYICLEVLQLLKVDLGSNDTLSCVDFEFNVPKQYQLYSNSSGYDTLIWTSNGNGIFDNPNILDPSYTFSAQDIISGSVTFKLTAYSKRACTFESSDSMTVLIPSQLLRYTCRLEWYFFLYKSF